MRTREGESAFSGTLDSVLKKIILASLDSISQIFLYYYSATFFEFSTTDTESFMPLSLDDSIKIFSIQILLSCPRPVNMAFLARLPSGGNSISLSHRKGGQQDFKNDEAHQAHITTYIDFQLIKIFLLYTYIMKIIGAELEGSGA